MTARMEWQPIETAPKDGALILGCHHDAAFQNPAVIYWERGSVEFSIVGHWRTSFHEPAGENRFTHWMPLPEPPK